MVFNCSHLSRGAVGGSLGSIAGLRLWVVVCMVVSLAFIGLCFLELGCFVGSFIVLLFLDSGYRFHYIFYSFRTNLQILT